MDLCLWFWSCLKPGIRTFLILRVARWITGFFEGVWGSDLVLGRGLWFLPTSVFLCLRAAGASRSSFPTPTFFTEFGIFLRNSANLTSSCPPGLTRTGLRPCPTPRAPLLGGFGFRIWGEVLEDDLFVAWPDVLLQLCLGKCPWMVCCCHTSFNSVPSFY